MVSRLKPKLKDVFGDGSGAKYAVCSRCQGVVRLNKFLLGSWHICLSDEDVRRRDSDGIRRLLK